MAICGMNISSQADLNFNTNSNAPPDCAGGSWNGARLYVNDFDGNITFPDGLFSNQIVFLDNPSLGAVDLTGVEYANVLEFDTGSTDFRYLTLPDIPSDSISGSVTNLFFHGPDGGGPTDQGPDTIVYGDIDDGLLYLTMNNNYMVFQDLQEINRLTLDEACIQGSALKTVKQAFITAPTCDMDTYLRGVKSDSLDYMELRDVSAYFLDGGVARSVSTTMLIDGINTKPAYGETSDVANFNMITEVGQNLTISSGDGVHIKFDKLASVGSLNVTANSGDCDVSFKNLNNVQNDIIMTNNGDMKIPGDMQALQRVGNVHLNGIIGGPLGSNIFPALTSATGSITIEAWNADFDCGPLLALKKQSKLGGSLSCNGTGTTNSGSGGSGGTTGTPTSGEEPTNTSISDSGADDGGGTGATGDSSPSNNSSSGGDDDGGGLSSGAEIAIGVLAGAIGLAIVAGLIWFLFFLRPKRQKQAEEAEKEKERERERRNNRELLQQQDQMGGGGMWAARNNSNNDDDDDDYGDAITKKHHPTTTAAAELPSSSPHSINDDNGSATGMIAASTGGHGGGVHEMETTERKLEMLANEERLYHELDSNQVPVELEGDYYGDRRW